MVKDLKTLRVEHDDFGVLSVFLARPDRLNAFTATMGHELRAVWRAAATDPDVRAIVLTGTGRAFCTGDDREESIDIGVAHVWDRDDPGRRLGPKSSRCWKPVVCAVNGIAAGGAFYLINESDIVIASRRAEFFDPHLSYGMVSACEPIGALGRMPYAEVMRMVLLGLNERIGPDRAYQLGLVSEVVEADRLVPAAQSLAREIALHSTLAVQGSVRAVWTAHAAVTQQAAEHAIQYTNVGNDPDEVAAGIERLRSRERPAYRVR